MPEHEMCAEEKKNVRPAQIIKYILYFLLIPLVVIGGTLIFKEKMYAWISVCVLVIAIVPFFFFFEKRKLNIYRMVLLAVLIALSVLGRFAFVGIPFFKPVTAVVVLAGTYLGMECGFLCGALSAVLSNFYFGQGPWTPVQMLVWGLLGLIAGMLAGVFRKYKWTWLIYGAVAGIAYSMAMDVWTCLETDGTFEFSRYLTYVVAAIPVTAVYMISNVIFLLVLGYPIGKKLERMKTKYGV